MKDDANKESHPKLKLMYLARILSEEAGYGIAEDESE